MRLAEGTVRFGIPRAHPLELFGDAEHAALCARTCGQLERSGAVVEIDFEPFREAARLLYEGPWVAERYAAVGDFIGRHPWAVHR